MFPITLYAVVTATSLQIAYLSGHVEWVTSMSVSADGVRKQTAPSLFYALLLIISSQTLLRCS